MRWLIGDVEIVRIIEVARAALPTEYVTGGITAEQVLALEWMKPHFCDPSGKVILSFHAFLVRAESKMILVDTCFGAGRDLPSAMFCNLGRGFLDNLASAGAKPEDVDIVLCTHMHYDHVGWNTQNEDGQWVPTFRNARYLYSAKDYEIMQERAGAGDSHAFHFVDTILPPVSAGLVDFIDVVDGYQLCDAISLLSTPGHSPDHFSVLISSKGENAVITGDIMHSPAQCAYPDKHPNADEDKAIAADTRRKFLERFGDSGVLILGTHFPTPTAGFIERSEEAWRFTGPT